ncbi:class I SAM-dependent methyltransferase [Allokutzneria sp. A3M-2-11 16]|uniref:class I SAM-dependent methyltransferase n=1 Tax=Allokutzneria sp. A3M-2-11 16 TaxID=2962043 RepID=UPI0020B8236A|nr:class I SAM-dependent methyltransferase [Allokutzneria sp. A3M-2-11 16]MCP3804685.1 class I SAM-dependent methyltransferase [Allokutzneria sp. A3M-2-11 16]
MRRTFTDFTIEVDMKRPDFLRSKGNGQRNLLLGRAVAELAADLHHLDAIQQEVFVDGAWRPHIRSDWSSSGADYSDSSQLLIEGQQVMQDWEHPLMRKLAENACQSRGDILEVGFGMGISAGYVQACGVRSHTIIEINKGVAERFEDWRAQRPGADIRLAFGGWQDVIDDLGQFDGILYDTYPTNEDEFVKTLGPKVVTLAANFFPAAAAHLRPGGTFSYYTNEIDSLSRAHQRLLLEHFSSFEVELVRDLHPPADCTYWWADRMAAVTAYK